MNCENDKERLVNRSNRRTCLVAEDNEDREEENEEVDRTARLLKSNFDLDFFFCLFASAALLVTAVTLFKRRLIEN